MADTQSSLPIANPTNARTFYDDDADRVFCLSMQRTGTSSTGRFFRDFGYSWAGWPADERNQWSQAWYRGDFEAIFSSPEFRAANAFEDSPWFLPEFYKVLFHRFPKARFVLFTRDPEAWFRSMVSHSRGDIVGSARIHSKIYRREKEFFDLVGRGVIDEAIESSVYSRKTMKMGDCPQRYMDFYRLHAVEVEDFFRRHKPSALHVGRLEDPGKWQRLGAFLGIAVPASYESHENRSPVTANLA